MMAEVSDPTLTVYRPPEGTTTSAAVVVFPGGGYKFLSVDLEGVKICQWLNSLGITGILLQYRVRIMGRIPITLAPCKTRNAL